MQSTMTPAVTGQTLMSVEQSRAITEVQGQIFSAKQYPRNEQNVFDRVLVACSRKSFAETALYEYPRGGQSVEGPSIRMAETLGRLWGNLDFGIRELEHRPGESIMMAFCHDLETNVRQTRNFIVKHERETKNSSTALKSQRDIYENNANLGARRLRACILGVIPADIVEAAVDKVKETLKGNNEPMTARVQKMITAFAEYGVTKEMIETRLTHKIEAMKETELISLGKIYNSIKDGYKGVEDYFPVAPGAAPLVKDDLPEQQSSTANTQVKSAKSIKNHAPQSKEEAEKKASDQDVATEPANKGEEKENPFTEQLKAFNREDVGKEIVAIALKMGIKGTANLTKKIQEKLPGKTLGQLTNDEMSGVLDWFKIEHAKMAADGPNT